MRTIRPGARCRAEPTKSRGLFQKGTSGASRAPRPPRGGNGAPGGIRTPDQWLRKPLLYPAELRAHGRVGGRHATSAGRAFYRKRGGGLPGPFYRFRRGRGLSIFTRMSYERFEAPSAPPWRIALAQYWKLVRGDRPIGWLLLLWPTWWALWLAAERRAAAVDAVRVHRRGVADAFGRLRDQRLRRPLARPAGGAHTRPPAGHRRGVAGARRWWCSRC